MAQEHTVRAFDEDLKKIHSAIGRMGGFVEAQLDEAITAIVRRDSDRARKVIADDKAIDRMEDETNELAVRLLALRQPMAIDLRAALAALKIAADLERIGDYSKNIAKRAIALNRVPHIDVAGLPRMARMVQALVKDVLDAYLQRDAEKAVQVWSRDAEVDNLYTSLFRELLTYMMEDPRNISPCTHLLFIAKNIERMGDHATNIAETIHFQVTGRRLVDDRPKGDETSYAVVDPADIDRAQAEGRQ